MVNYRSALKEKKFFIFICDSAHVKTHTHNFLELAYVLSGQATHTRDNDTMEIGRGDYFVIDYCSRHSYTAKTDDFLLINCLFVPELIDSSLIDCRSLATLISSYQIHFNSEFFISNPATSIFKDENGKIREILLQMLSEFEERAPGYLQIIRSKTVEVLVETMRKICIDSLEESNRGIDAMLKFVGSEYMKDITLSDLCKKFGYSFTYLSAKFKKETGLNFTQYLQKTRIEQSMRLLANTDQSIHEIASAVGYKDLKSYYTVFKKFADTTPGKFRRNYHKDI